MHEYQLSKILAGILDHLSQFIKVQFVPLVSFEPAADILLCKYDIIWWLVVKAIFYNICPVC